MKYLVYLDTDIKPKKFSCPEEAIVFVENKFKDDPDFTLKWRRGNTYSEYTQQQLLDEIAQKGKVCLQLVQSLTESDDPLTIFNTSSGEIFDILTEELDRQENEKSDAEIAVLGQQLADGYNSEIILHRAGEQIGFKPTKVPIGRHLLSTKKGDQG